MPPDAEIVTRRGLKMARWTDGHGKTRWNEIDPDGERIVFETATYTARYRDADGVMRRLSTGCRDEQAARQVLAQILSEVEKVKSGILSREEATAGGHANSPVSAHVRAYAEHLRACERTTTHIATTKAYIEKVAAGCGFRRLRDLDRRLAEKWMLREAERGRSARSRNAHRLALVAFGNWLVRESRILANPFDRLPRANEAADRRRERRALSADEIARLFQAAAQRPLRQAMTITRGRRKGELRAKVTDRTRRRAEQAGRERAMFYRIAIYTGLRVSELASITLGDVHLDTKPAYVELRAEHEKSRRGARQPLGADLARAIRAYLEQRLVYEQEEARDEGRPPPVAIGRGKPLVRPPTLRTFNADLEAAGIAKKDEYGRTVDLHSLRHTFGTLLARSGAHPRTAMELMRHSDIRLTTRIYQHLELADTASALDRLPSVGTDAEDSAVAG